MDICRQCGTENRPEARFCRSCGEPFVEAGLVELSVEASDRSEPQPEPLNLPVLDELPEGDVLHERYRIQRQQEEADGGFLYEAEDLLLCPACQALQTTAETAFCEACGADLAVKPAVILHARPTPAGGEPADGQEFFIEKDLTFRVERLALAPEPANPPRSWRLASGVQSHPGQVRENNEDSLVALQLTGLCDASCALLLGFFAVADGVGGAASGEIASQTAVRQLAGGVLQRIFGSELAGAPVPVDDLPGLVRELVLAANQAILDLRDLTADNDMGCTLTGTLLRNNQAVLVNVGDSRIYRLHQGKLSRLTQDHSLVARLVEEGLIQPEEVYTHAQRSIIYRSLGSRSDLEVDVFAVELEAGDRLLLCCDGLWEMVRDAMIEEVLLQGYDPQQTCNRLVELANLAGGEDNVSVIVLELQETST